MCLSEFQMSLLPSTVSVCASLIWRRQRTRRWNFPCCFNGKIFNTLFDIINTRSHLVNFCDDGLRHSLEPGLLQQKQTVTTVKQTYEQITLTTRYTSSSFLIKQLWYCPSYNILDNNRMEGTLLELGTHITNRPKLTSNNANMSTFQNIASMRAASRITITSKKMKLHGAKNLTICSRRFLTWNKTRNTKPT